MFQKAITAILARSAVLAVLAISALAQAHSSWGQQTGLTNPGFEAPRVEEGTFVLADVLLETMPGWKTTDTHFEIWGTGFKGVPAHEGTQFVELNAYINGTLYQDSTGIQQGSVLEFTFAHRGRNGDDTMKMTITDLGADNSLGGGDDTVLFTKQYTTGNDAWAVYDSTNEQQIKALGNTVRFGYGAVSTATGELGEGNLLDAANFGVGVVTAPPIAAGGTETNKLGMEFKLIPAGTFLMGSPDSEEGHDDDEQLHEVTITRDYYMGVNEVTQSQWQQVMGTTPWKGQENVEEGKDNPATCISWNDAAEFCRKLSQQEGTTYRLPTEAEWEYACRAGTTTPYSFGDDASQLEQYAWYFDSEPTHPSQVQQKSPNGFGLYDMHGNLWEFCQDWYGAYPQASVTDPTGPSNGTHHVMRGGSYVTKAPKVRSAHRNYPADLAKSENVFGLRVVMVPGSDSDPLAMNETEAGLASTDMAFYIQVPAQDLFMAVPNSRQADARPAVVLAEKSQRGDGEGQVTMLTIKPVLEKFNEQEYLAFEVTNLPAPTGQKLWLTMGDENNLIISPGPTNNLTYGRSYFLIGEHTTNKEDVFFQSHVGQRQRVRERCEIWS